MRRVRLTEPDPLDSAHTQSLSVLFGCGRQGHDKWLNPTAGFLLVWLNSVVPGMVSAVVFHPAVCFTIMFHRPGMNLGRDIDVTGIGEMQGQGYFGAGFGEVSPKHQVKAHMGKFHLALRRDTQLERGIILATPSLTRVW